MVQSSDIPVMLTQTYSNSFETFTLIKLKFVLSQLEVCERKICCNDSLYPINLRIFDSW